MLVNILNEIIPPNSKRIVYLYNDTSKDSIDFNLDPNIKMVQYSGKHKLKFLLRLLYLYRIVKQESPDKVFCFSIQGAYLSLIVKNLLFFKFKIIYRMVSVDTALVNSKE